LTTPFAPSAACRQSRLQGDNERRGTKLDNQKGTLQSVRSADGDPARSPREAGGEKQGSS